MKMKMGFEEHEELIEKYLKDYNLQSLYIDKIKHLKIKKQLKKLDKLAKKLNYIVPKYSIVYTKSNLDAFGYSIYYPATILNDTFNLIHLEVDLIELDFNTYINDILIHEYAHMIEEYLKTLNNENEDENNDNDNNFYLNIHSNRWKNIFISLGGFSNWYKNNTRYEKILFENNILVEFNCLCKNIEPNYLHIKNYNEFNKSGKTFLCEKCNQPVLPLDYYNYELNGKFQELIE